MYNVVNATGEDLRIVERMVKDNLVGFMVNVYSAEQGCNDLVPKFLKETINIVVKNTDKFSVKGAELYKSKKLSSAIDKDVYVHTKKARDLVDFKIKKPFCRKVFIFESECQSIAVGTEGYNTKIGNGIAFVDGVEIKLSGFSCTRVVEKTAKNYFRVSEYGYDRILSEGNLISDWELKEGTPVIIEGDDDISIRYVDSTDTVRGLEGKYEHWLRIDKEDNTEL